MGRCRGGTKVKVIDNGSFANVGVGSASDVKIIDNSGKVPRLQGNPADVVRPGGNDTASPDRESAWPSD
ncbi:hypothetical protein Ahu01nite_000590 [Winogradskya humida]|uniref:Pectate lyase n=1 Tax=Winogradskya humida TaxID=113566 RepID=A0ABQ3ZFC7_9ACTN|nr:hypothetical protein Ahu01nite_000590 [Actinoplanes humidus]